MQIDLNDIQDGAYAKLRETPPWGLLKRVGKFAGRENLSDEESVELSSLMLNNLVKEWNITDDDGNAVPLPKNAQDSQLDNVDGRIIVRILSEGKKILESVKLDPNSNTAS